MQLVLDFDCTISEGMVYDNLGNGNVARAKQMTDLWWTSQFGGATRMRMLDDFFERLEDIGVTAFICSHNNHEVIIEALSRTKLARFFASEDGMFRIIGTPGVDKASRLRKHIDCMDVRVEDMMFVDDSAGNCNSVARVLPSLKVHKCNPTGLTRLDCNFIVQHFQNRLRERTDTSDLGTLNVTYDGENMLNVTFDGSEVAHGVMKSPRLSFVGASALAGGRTVAESALSVMRKLGNVQAGSLSTPCREANSLRSRRQSISAHEMLSPRTVKLSAPQDSNMTPSSAQKVRRRHSYEQDTSTIIGSGVHKGHSCELPMGSARALNSKVRQTPPDQTYVRQPSPDLSYVRQPSPDLSYVRQPSPDLSYVRPNSPNIAKRTAAHAAGAPARSQSISIRVHRSDVDSTKNSNARVARAARIMSQKMNYPSASQKQPPSGAPLVSHPPLHSQMPISKFAKCALATVTPSDSATSLPSGKTSRLGGA